MKKQAAIDHFGGVGELATALKLTPAAISQWGEYPPPLRQLQIERIAPELKAEEGCMEAVLGLPFTPWNGKGERRAGPGDRRKGGKGKDTKQARA